MIVHDECRKNLLPQRSEGIDRAPQLSAQGLLDAQ